MASAAVRMRKERLEISAAAKLSLNSREITPLGGALHNLLFHLQINQKTPRGREIFVRRS
jgi:hypothetical protein